MKFSRISTLAAPIAAMALGALALSACGGSEEQKLAENGYTIVPTERNPPDFPSSGPSRPSPGTLGNPDTTTVPPARPQDPDDPAPLPPGSPPPPLPN
jgi:hypothetical protein